VDTLKQVNDMAVWFCEVATAAGVVVNGYYEVRDFPGLCTTLTERLYEQRTSLIILGGKK